MYTLIMTSQTGESLTKSGKLPEMLKLARQLHNRLGMNGDIRRPDGTSMREHSRAWNNLFWLKYPLSKGV